jgi:hypothetical protein
VEEVKLWLAQTCTHCGQPRGDHSLCLIGHKHDWGRV